MQLKQQFVYANGVRYFIKSAGDKSAPLILFLHGFPDSWYSWRHQLTAMAEAGYYAVAPDMLGCGETDAPMEIERYSQDEMAKDIVGMITALGHGVRVMLEQKVPLRNLLFPTLTRFIKCFERKLYGAIM